MRVAVAVRDDNISGPGEAAEIRIYNIQQGYELEESYSNPALTAPSAKGIMMLKSIVDRGVTSAIISGIGAHAFSYGSGRIKLYAGENLPIDDALKRFAEGALKEITGPSH